MYFASIESEIRVFCLKTSHLGTLLLQSCRRLQLDGWLQHHLLHTSTMPYCCSCKRTMPCCCSYVKTLKTVRDAFILCASLLFRVSLFPILQPCAEHERKLASGETTTKTVNIIALRERQGVLCRMPFEVFIGEFRVPRTRVESSLATPLLLLHILFPVN